MIINLNKIRNWLSLATAISIIAYAFYRYSSFITGPIEMLVYGPIDDAYYYWQTAFWMAKDGIWSNDGGISFTNGFHPLFMWVCKYTWILAGIETSREHYTQIIQL